MPAPTQDLAATAMDVVAAENIKTIAGHSAADAARRQANQTTLDSLRGENLAAFQHSMLNTMSTAAQVWTQRMIEYQPLEAIADSRAGQANGQNQILGLASAIAASVAMISKVQEAPAPQPVPATRYADWSNPGAAPSPV